MIHLKPGVNVGKNCLIESVLHRRPGLTDVVTGTEDEIITRLGLLGLLGNYPAQF